MFSHVFPIGFLNPAFVFSDLGAGHSPHGYVVELLGQPEITNVGSTTSGKQRFSLGFPVTE